MGDGTAEAGLKFPGRLRDETKNCIVCLKLLDETFPAPRHSKRLLKKHCEMGARERTETGI